MRKLLLTGLAVLGIVVACDKDSAWELDQEQRIEALQVKTAKTYKAD